MEDVPAGELLLVLVGIELRRRIDDVQLGVGPEVVEHRARVVSPRSAPISTTRLAPMASRTGAMTTSQNGNMEVRSVSSRRRSQPDLSTGATALTIARHQARGQLIRCREAVRFLSDTMRRPSATTPPSRDHVRTLLVSVRRWWSRCWSAERGGRAEMPQCHRRRLDDHHRSRRSRARGSTRRGRRTVSFERPAPDDDADRPDGRPGCDARVGAGSRLPGPRTPTTSCRSRSSPNAGQVDAERSLLRAGRRLRVLLHPRAGAPVVPSGSARAGDPSAPGRCRAPRRRSSRAAAPTTRELLPGVRRATPTWRPTTSSCTGTSGRASTWSSTGAGAG